MAMATHIFRRIGSPLAGIAGKKLSALAGNANVEEQVQAASRVSWEEILSRALHPAVEA